MSYAEKVNHARGLVSAKTVIPPDVFAYSLSLKQPEALARRDTPELLTTYPQAAQMYEKARTIGNASVRLALASYLASTHDPDTPFLGDLSEHSREEILDEFFSQGGGFIGLSDTEVNRRLFVTKRSMLSTTDRRGMVGSYINVRPGSYAPGQPPTGFGYNDSLYVQAFGRNTYTDSELTSEIVEPRRALRSDEVMFERLKSLEFDEGDSNRALAELPARILQDPLTSIEQVLQWEVAYSLWKNYPELFSQHRVGIHVLWPKSNFYPTYDVKADSVAVSRERGLYNPLELAHRDMTIRALGIIAKLGVQADAIAADVPFDARSTQSQVRGPSEWMRREILTRVHHVVTNKVRF